MQEQLGQYNFLDAGRPTRLGRCYRARDTVAGRTVLVHDMTDVVGPDPAVRSRFIADARAAVAISHPNVARLFEVAEDRARLFLVFEFGQGEALGEVASGAFEPRQALELGVQLADALGAGHGQGIHHLDVRPDNIEVSRRGRAKLLAFGVADWARRREASDSAAAGTPEGGLYRSPEQRRDEPADHRSDLFSLGLVLYELLAGEPPPPNGSRLRPGTVNDLVPAELDAIVERATAEAPHDRYQSAVSLAAELRSVAAVLDVRTGDREPPRFVASAPIAEAEPRRWTRLWPLAVVLLVTLWWWLSRR